jgi:hypothetical protein
MLSLPSLGRNFIGSEGLELAHLGQSMAEYEHQLHHPSETFGP